MCDACQVSTELVTSCVQLSSECRSLLDRIFVADVKQRITVEGIMQHPWYQHPLPSHYQSQLQHLDQVQVQKDAHIQSRRIDPVRAAVTPLGIPLGAARKKNKNCCFCEQLMQEEDPSRGCWDYRRCPHTASAVGVHALLVDMIGSFCVSWLERVSRVRLKH